MLGMSSALSGCAVGLILIHATAAVAEVQVEQMSFSGLCEASAAVSLDSSHFVVASDESNELRIYGVDGSGPVIAGNFTDDDKSDLEAATIIGDRIYWISSHSFNSKGEDKPKRKRLFATEVVDGDNGSSLRAVGTPYGALRDAVAAVAGFSNSEINIEGLAATPEGHLLIGFRNLKNGNALIVPLENPSEVVASGESPKFGTVDPLDLGGRGIRSIEAVAGSYLIVAGRGESDDFALFRWAGPHGAAPEPVEGINFEGLRPEALFTMADGAVWILSDDGADDCDDEKTPEADRSFRSLTVRGLGDPG